MCKYFGENLILNQELIRHTPEDHPDYQPLLIVLDLFNILVENINQRQNEGVNLKYPKLVQDIQYVYLSKSFLNLICSNRRV